MSKSDYLIEFRRLSSLTSGEGLATSLVKSVGPDTLEDLPASTQKAIDAFCEATGFDFSYVSTSKPLSLVFEMTRGYEAQGSVRLSKTAIALLDSFPGLRWVETDGIRLIVGC